MEKLYVDWKAIKEAGMTSEFTRKHLAEVHKTWPDLPNNNSLRNSLLSGDALERARDRVMLTRREYAEKYPADKVDLIGILEHEPENKMVQAIEREAAREDYHNAQQDLNDPFA